MVMAEARPGNAEVLSAGWSGSGRGAEVEEAENTAAIVWWPAVLSSFSSEAFLFST